MGLWVKVPCGGALLRRSEGTGALKLDGGAKRWRREVIGDRGRAVCSLEGI